MRQTFRQFTEIGELCGNVETTVRRYDEIFFESVTRGYKFDAECGRTVALPSYLTRSFPSDDLDRIVSTPYFWR